MSNHCHVVLYINIDQAQGWSTDEIIKRWHQLYGGFALSQRYLSGTTLGKAELATLNERAEVWREHLILKRSVERPGVCFWEYDWRNKKVSE